jgi:predicted dehydrogenase
MHESVGAHVNLATTPERQSAPTNARKSLRIGFVGTGWIGQNRMRSVISNPSIEPIAIVEPDASCAKAANEIAQNKAAVCSFTELLEMEPDGVVLATPNDLHFDQALAALHRGISVFCQKPLGRDLAETHRVVEAAHRADRLLRVDFSYRYLEGIRQIRSLLLAGELGSIYAIDLTFHNAYGPASSWFYDRQRSGGGSLIDLGIHLVDLAFWLLNYPEIVDVTSHLFAKGKPYRRNKSDVEDHAEAYLSFADGCVARVGCSWKSNIGSPALIEIKLFGAKGGACLRNVEGSFFDFIAERFQGTAQTMLSAPPDDWSGKALADWLTRLQGSNAFDPEVRQIERVASVLDRIYDQCAS